MNPIQISKRFILATVFSAVSGSICAATYDTTANGQRPSPEFTRYSGGNEVLLQGFHWFTANNSRREASSTNKWYAKLKTAADNPSSDLRLLGMTAIWMAPPWEDSSSWENGKTGDVRRDAGGTGYMWKSFNKNSNYGTDQQLKDAAASLKNTAGMKVIYDMVTNHSDPYANSGNHAIFGRRQSGNYNWAWCVDQYAVNNTTPTSANAACDDRGYFENGEKDINLRNSYVNNAIKDEHVNLVTNYSADGFRYDVATGIAPSNVKAWNVTASPTGFCVGEYWGEGSTDVWGKDAECTAFDFDLKNQIQTGNINNVKWGLNANSSAAVRARSTTFVDNHDTGWSPLGRNLDFGDTYWGQRFKETPGNIKSQAYAYILLSPGTPSIYLPDVLTDNLVKTGLYDMVKKLVTIRKDANILADSGIGFDPNQAGAVGVVWASNKRVVFAIGNTTFNDPKTFNSGVCSDCASKTWVLADSDSAAGYKVWVEGSAPPPSPNCGPGGNTYVCNYTTMFVRGTCNAWGGTAMAAIGNNVWEATCTFTGAGVAGNRDRFKFNPSTANWTVNWGDTTDTGATDCSTSTCTGDLASATDINVCSTNACSGTYTIQFNDSTKVYSRKVVQQGYIDTSNKRPVANMSAPVNTASGAAGLTVRAGTALTLTSASTDANNDTLTYSWACSGTCTPALSSTASTLSYTPTATSGTSVITLTVNDGKANQSATGAITSGSTAMTLSAANNNVGPDHTISGTGIPTGTKVVSMSADGKTITMSDAATATNGAVSLTFSSNTAAKSITLSHEPTYYSSYSTATVEIATTGNTASPTGWVAAGGMKMTADYTWSLSGINITSISGGSPVLAFRVNMGAGTGSAQTVTAAGVYTIVYNDSTTVYTKTLTGQVNTCDTVTGGSTFSYVRVDLRGQFNTWGNTAMVKVANNTWRKLITTGTATQQFKLDTCNTASCVPNWAVSFGETGTADGKADQNGGNINLVASTTYCMEFNDSTKLYKATKQ